MKKETKKVNRDELIKKHSRLIFAIAQYVIKKYDLTPDIIDDLVQEGNIGLLKSLKNFDEKQGVKFSTFAYRRILGAMIRFLKKNNLVFIPDTIRREARGLNIKINEYINRLSQKLGRMPTLEEISSISGYSRHEIENSINITKMQKASSLNIPIGAKEKKGRGEMIDYIIDRFTDSQYEILASQELHTKLYKILNTLPEKEAKIISMRFGLEDGREYSIRELARKFKMSRYKIERLEDEAAWRLASDPKLAILYEIWFNLD